MAEVIARLSGVLAYSDGSKAQFAVQLDRRGNISMNSKNGDKEYNQASLVEAHADSETRLASMFALLSGITFSGPAGSATHTITALEAELSGRVTIDSPTPGTPTWEDFIVQYTSSKANPGAFTPTGGSGSTAWAAAKTAGLAALNSMFSGLGITAA